MSFSGNRPMYQTKALPTIQDVVIMTFKWWKRPAVKPIPKSRFPIKVKIDQTPRTSPGVDHSSGKTSRNGDTAHFYNLPDEATCSSSDNEESNQFGLCGFCTGNNNRP
jgi:hypothetical protein